MFFVKAYFWNLLINKNFLFWTSESEVFVNVSSERLEYTLYSITYTVYQIHSY